MLVDVTDVEVETFAQTQATGVEGGEKDAVSIERDVT